MENDLTHKIGRLARGRNTAAAMLAAFVVGAALARLGVDLGIPASNAMDSPLAPDRLSIRLSFCGESHRVNCVVDGGTFLDCERIVAEWPRPPGGFVDHSE